MKKIFNLIIPTSLLLLFTACSVGSIDRSKVISAPRDYELTILHLGNTNGQIESGQNTGIGYSRFSTILERARTEFGKENTLYLDAGNTFYGSNIANNDKGESTVKILNALNLDAMTLGINDFNYDEKNIKSLEMRANFKILGANIKKQDNQNFVTPYIIKNINGIKVGIFGLISPDIYNNEKALFESITIDEPIVTANKIVKELKSQGVEFIIALTNLGIDDNINKEWQSTTLAESVSGIDLIIDGNSKNPLEEKIMINNTAIVQTGENLKNIGVLKIDFDAPKRDEERIFYKLIKKDDIVMVDDAPIQTIKENTTNKNFVTHTVVKGDTLYSLARKYQTTVNDIVALNPSIEDGKTISIGQTYVMISDNNSLNSKVPSENNNEYLEYTVIKGDTLYSLARKYQTTVNDIIKINPEITDGQNIKIGHTYKIPSKIENTQEISTSEENINNNFEEETLSSEMPDVSNNNIKVSASNGIEKDPKIENLIAKIKAAQSFIK